MHKKYELEAHLINHLQNYLLYIIIQLQIVVITRFCKQKAESDLHRYLSVDRGDE